MYAVFGNVFFTDGALLAVYKTKKEAIQAIRATGAKQHGSDSYYEVVNDAGNSCYYRIIKVTNDLTIGSGWQHPYSTRSKKE